MDKALLKNEWIYVELKLSIGFETAENVTKWSSTEMGIHVWKETNNTNEDVIFSNPYTGITPFNTDFLLVGPSLYHLLNFVAF